MKKIFFIYICLFYLDSIAVGQDLCKKGKCPEDYFEIEGKCFTPVREYGTAEEQCSRMEDPERRTETDNKINIYKKRIEKLDKEYKKRIEKLDRRANNSSRRRNGKIIQIKRKIKDKRRKKIWDINRNIKDRRRVLTEYASKEWIIKNIEDSGGTDLEARENATNKALESILHELGEFYFKDKSICCYINKYSDPRVGVGTEKELFLIKFKILFKEYIDIEKDIIFLFKTEEDENGNYFYKIAMAVKIEAENPKNRKRKLFKSFKRKKESSNIETFKQRISKETQENRNRKSLESFINYFKNEYNDYVDTIKVKGLCELDTGILKDFYKTLSDLEKRKYKPDNKNDCF